MDVTNIITILFALLLRWTVSFSPYSGQDTPPMYGDYEAQRHWMEITVNLEPREWYTNSTDNDLLYWGLDYPPLTAYHSYLMGRVAKYINPKWIRLFESRGFESPQHKLFMRSTVLVGELLVYLSALYCFWNVLKSKSSLSSTYFLRTLLVPSLILIDYGHFQYNTIPLGLFIWTVVFLDRNQDFLAAIAFCLALNYKQMALYYSLPIFFFLLKRCVEQKSLPRILLKLTALGLAVSSTFALLWLPYLTDLDSLLQVVRRIFPLNRGIYEDKVANFWYCISILVKVKNYLQPNQLAYLSAFLTMLFSIPVCYQLYRCNSPLMLKYSLVNVSLAFYLFSFQVHEKTILFVEIPLMLLSDVHPFPVVWFSLISVFSLQPLLAKDGLMNPYFSLTVIYLIICQNVARYNRKSTNLLFAASLGIATVLSITSLALTPPARLPHLHTLLNSLYSFVHFGLFFVYFLHQQSIHFFGQSQPSHLTYVKPKVKTN